MTASGLGYRKTLVGTGRVISLFLCMNHLENSILAYEASISDNDTFCLVSTGHSLVESHDY